MATANEMQEKLTIFYKVSTGEIKACATGIQDMRYFGADEDTYSTGEGRWDYIVTENDSYVMMNQSLFQVVNGELSLKPNSSLMKYL